MRTRAVAGTVLLVGATMIASAFSDSSAPSAKPSVSIMPKPQVMNVKRLPGTNEPMPVATLAGEPGAVERGQYLVDIIGCNDCHTPAGFVPKYFTKADHGFFHSLAFTTDKFHEPIQMKERSRRVTEAACRRCHQDIVHDIEGISPASNRMSCIRCHASVGHPK